MEHVAVVSKRGSWTAALLKKAAHTKAIIVERLSRSPHGRGDEADTGSTLSTMSVDEGVRGSRGASLEVEFPFSGTHTATISREQDRRSFGQPPCHSRVTESASGREEPVLSTTLKRVSFADQWEGERVTLSGCGREHVARGCSPSFPPGLLERGRPNIAHVFCGKIVEDFGDFFCLDPFLPH